MARIDWITFLVYIGVSLPSCLLKAEPIQEQVGRIKLDWGNMTVRFSGYFKPDSQNANLSYSESEQRAMSEGLLQAREVLVKIHERELKRQKVSPELANQSAVSASDYVTRTTYSYDTAFFKGGGVQVSLENNLAKVFVRKDLPFRKAFEEKKGSSNARFDGLILRLDKGIKPVPRYEIVDQSGAVLFSVESMTREAYEKNLMGRWFTEPQREELKYLGPKRVSLQVKVVGSDRLMVQKGAWTDALQDSMQVLSEGRIALVIPK